MKKILALLLSLCLLIPTAFAQPAVSPLAVDKGETSFTSQAIENGRRVKSLITFETNNDLFESWKLQNVGRFLNNLSIETVYQKNGSMDQFWSKTFRQGQDSLLSFNSLTYADDVYLSSSLLANQALAFTPYEVVNFFSTILSTFASAFRSSTDISTALMYGQLILNSLAQNIGESATWNSLTGLFSSFNLDASLFYNEEAYQAMEDFFNEVVVLLKEGEVATPDLAAFINMPSDAKATQYVFEKEHIDALLALVKKWSTEEEYVTLWLATVNNLPQLANLTPQQFAQESLETIEEFEEDVTDHLIYPVIVTLWHQNNTLVQGDFTCKFADDVDAETKDITNLHGTYLLAEKEDGSTQHQGEISLYNDDHELTFTASFKPTYTRVVEETELLSSLIDISFINKENINGAPRVKQGSLKAVYEGVMEENNRKSNTQFGFSLLKDENGKTTNSALSLKVDDLSTLKGSDAQNITTIALDLEGELGDGRAFTIKKETASGSPEEDLPPENVTRLGRMDQEKLTLWAGQAASEVIQVLEQLLSLLPIEDLKPLIAPARSGE